MWINNIFRIIRQHNGLFKTILALTRNDEVKMGEFIGQDCFGNRYYENPYYFFGRNRWVVYSNRFGYDYDGSCIHPEWYRWMHQMTDIPPNKETDRVCYDWMLPYTPNPTGTKSEYVPYSTTQPKIIPWKPPPKLCNELVKKEKTDC